MSETTATDAPTAEEIKGTKRAAEVRAFWPLKVNKLSIYRRVNSTAKLWKYSVFRGKNRFRALFSVQTWPF